MRSSGARGRRRRTPYDRSGAFACVSADDDAEYRFLTEVWTADGPKLQIASTSWKSLVEHERLDEAYRVFVTELCRRVGAAGGQTLFQVG